MRKQAPLALLLLSSCTLTPDLKMPEISIPSFFKEAPAPEEQGKVEGAFAKADPQPIQQTEWWRVFADEDLNTLMAQAMAENPSLQASAERLAQARAQAGVSESNLYPDVTLGAGVTRQQSSVNAQDPTFPISTKPHTTYTVNGTIDYGLDLFGMARANYRAAAYGAEGAEASLRAAQLLLQAQVAETYFTLRARDKELDVINETIRLRAELEELTAKRVELGEASDLDNTRARGELALAKSDAFAVKQQRAQAEHALAALLGKVPADFALAAQPLRNMPPAVPAGLPSHLLERRPDIQAAQRAMAAANERIGVARAAFFPRINLTAGGGFSSRDLGDLFKWSSKSWILGPLSGTEITLPVFDGGRNFANLALSKASFREAVALYREQVLQAFKEVEDALSGVANLQGQAKAQADAVAAASRAYDIAKIRYESGYASYLELLDAQRTQLQASRGEVQVQGAAYAQTVQLIRALGGYWEMPGVAAPSVETPAVEAPAAPVPIAPAPVTDTQQKPDAPFGETPAPEEKLLTPVEGNLPVTDATLETPPPAPPPPEKPWYNPF